MESTERIEVVDGVQMYRIPDVDRMDPFLMTIVSSSDLWMFASSTGALTAGRVEAADCLFPYETDDRLHQARGRVGPATVLRIRHPDATTAWEPFAGRGPGTRRSLLKSLLGNAVVFEEEHLGLGLVFRYRWAPSDRFGWVRTASLHNRSGDRFGVDVVDGLLGVMPWGIEVSLQQQMSNLANAYRRSEITSSGIGIFAIEARIIDRPEPGEALRATTVWTTGAPAPQLSVHPEALDRARRGQPFEPAGLRTGRPGSFVLGTSFDLGAGEHRSWHIVADVARSHADIALLDARLRTGEDLATQLEDDIARCSTELRAIVAGADGLQCTGSAETDAHHLANTLFNVMRGGTFVEGYSIRAERFRAFVADRNAILADRHAGWLDALPDRIDVGALRALASETAEPSLLRLAHEYLPLAFSRRHGDPSRPWNRFAIRVREDHGRPLLSYQGNWRDIFQNWEALCRSFPAFLPSVIAKFLNASTADGYNPYRITADGIDWEVPEPDNPWSGIGYWGDHQIVYLERLLSAQEAHCPGWLAAELGRQAYSFADPPYRIRPFEKLVREPKATIDYDVDAERATAARVAAMGADGQLVVDGAGRVVHVTFLEKLLVPALAKLSNFVPRGGIWMNTQRPEWNDANNALVGHGLSMVTLAHLRRYLALLAELAEELAESHPVSGDVVAWAEAVTAILESHEPAAGAGGVDDQDRARVLRALGTAYDEYRSRLYAAGPSAPKPFDPSTLRRLCRTGLAHLDDTIRANRREDGLYHSYNLVEYNLVELSEDAGAASVRHLPEMLEGQVAVISSGLLDAEEVVGLVRALYDSDLYRPDADSFMLYPARTRPPFLERNVVPAAAVESNPLLMALLDAGSEAVIIRDVDGRYRFHPDFGNVADLDRTLDELARTSLATLVESHRGATRDLFEAVFDHRAFTGRSSTMHAYEGIGSVYWHLVAKLLLAIGERILELDGVGPVEELSGLYDRVRQGLGFNKAAADYGAFPTDPYSHTPAHAGAQQPGMTGQVKEELLARWAELGVTVEAGSVCFTPALLRRRELRSEPGVFEYLDPTGRPGQLDVAPGAAALTLCQVPVVLQATTGGVRIRVTGADGTEREIEGWSLDAGTSGQVFDRAGAVRRLDVFVPESSLLG